MLGTSQSQEGKGELMILIWSFLVRFISISWFCPSNILKQMVVKVFSTKLLYTKAITYAIHGIIAFCKVFLLTTSLYIQEIKRILLNKTEDPDFISSFCRIPRICLDIAIDNKFLLAKNDCLYWEIARVFILNLRNALCLCWVNIKIESNWVFSNAETYSILMECWSKKYIYPWNQMIGDSIGNIFNCTYRISQFVKRQKTWNPTNL